LGGALGILGIDQQIDQLAPVGSDEVTAIGSGKRGNVAHGIILNRNRQIDARRPKRAPGLNVDRGRPGPSARHLMSGYGREGEGSGLRSVTMTPTTPPAKAGMRMDL